MKRGKERKKERKRKVKKRKRKRRAPFCPASKVGGVCVVCK
jgi:hypothetical protein